MTNSPSDNEMMSAEQFASYLEKRLVLLDTVEPLYRDGMQMRVSVQGRNFEVDLSTFYEAYRQHPDMLDTVAQTFGRVLLGETPDRAESDYNQLAERVFPMLKKIELLLTVRERNLPMIAYRDFLSNLIITYVIDEGNSVSYVNEDHLERWDISVQDLHAQALENLRRRTENVSSVSAGQGEQRLFIFNSGDGYDATRLLLSDVLQGWARSIRGALVVGIPNRDFLIALSDADPDVLQNVAMQIQADSVQKPFSLTDQLFTITGGQVREYEWE